MKALAERLPCPVAPPRTTAGAAIPSRPRHRLLAARTDAVCHQLSKTTASSAVTGGKIFGHEGLGRSGAMPSPVLAPPGRERAAARSGVHAGVYKTHFKNGLVSGETFTSENVLEIVKLARTQPMCGRGSISYNGHCCAIYGVAHV
jgi:hypothetical protein